MHLIKRAGNEKVRPQATKEFLRICCRTEPLGVENGIPCPRRRGFRTFFCLSLPRFSRLQIPQRDRVYERNGQKLPRHRGSRMQRSVGRAAEEAEEKKEYNFLSQ